MAKKTHTHHIIPRYMGGTDDPSNLVELTIEEHAEAHRELYEKHGNWQDRIAWQMLSGQITHYDAIQEVRRLANIGNKHFEGKNHTAEAKRNISEKMKVSMKGNQNRKGKLHSDETKEHLAEMSRGNTHRRGKKRSTAVTDAERNAISERMKGDANPAKRDEIRVVLSEQKKGENNHMFGRTGEAHPNWGVKRDDEFKKKMSDAKKEEAKRKRESGEYIEGLKYKNIILMNRKGEIIEVPDDYNAFFEEHDIQGFMKRIKKAVRGHVRGWRLVGYELRNPEKYADEIGLLPTIDLNNQNTKL